jgi:hypothetical protein
MQSSITGNGTTHVYYNISITNDDTTGKNKPPNIEFNETRTQPFLSNPSEYFMSVVRFSLDTAPGLPLFIPQAVIGGNGTDLIYTLTYSYSPDGGVTNYDLQQRLVYVPQEVDLTQPTAPITFADLSNPYYWISSYQWWNFEIFNEALSAGWAAFKAAYPTELPAAVYTAQTPYSQWDTGSNTSTLITPQTCFDQSASGQGDLAVKLYFNTPMFSLYPSFPSECFGWTNVANGKNYMIPIKNVGYNTSTDFLTNVTTIATFQEYTTTPLWNPIQSLVFTTALLPVVPELTAAPIRFGDSGSFISSGNNANLTNVLTDFEVALTKGSEYLPTVNYVPSSEYRLIDLFGTSPVNSINVNIFWRNRFGALIPVTLASGANCNIKIMFRRKDFNNLTVGY